MTNVQFCIARADYQQGKEVFEPAPPEKYYKPKFTATLCPRKSDSTPPPKGQHRR